MNIKVTLGIASTILLLTACGGPKEEYSKGISLLEKGDYESLVKAKKFFSDYAKKNPDDNKVSDYSKQVDEALLTTAKELANSYYNSKDNYKAMKYAKVAKELAPDDENVTKAYDLVNKAYKEQKTYDEFANYLEGKYIETKNIIDAWDTGKRRVQTSGGTNLAYMKSLSKSLFSRVTEVRQSVNDESFNISGQKQDILRQINSDLFEYVYSIESQLSETIEDKNAEALSDIDALTNGVTPESFNSTFLSLQNQMADYVSETNNEGKSIRHIKNTLNFTKAYKENQEALKKAAEETAKQNATKANVTDSTPASSTSATKQ
ncbi:hypothetical protein AAGG74_14515 [Bacillus mexicanus]|uniref:hypothetical protein n=1 Tax=Bacillus mexicanus TaxID=2834415 RepID=UPI003D1DD7FF